MRVWIDIDNAPQARYLTPFVHAFEQRGHEVFVTARDHGITYDLLDEQRVKFTAVGRRFSGGGFGKAAGVLRRAAKLSALAGKDGPPEVLLSSSRSSALAAWRLRRPAFIVCDYEHVELGLYRRAGAHLIYPGVIDRGVFLKKGFPSERLIPFDGLKEDITFAGRTLNREAGSSNTDSGGVDRILVRGPAEDSHYFTERSRQLFEQVVERLSRIEEVSVTLSPRDEGQVRRFLSHDWARTPRVLRHGVPALELFASVDLVVCGGGTMLREAAYLGVPAIGIFGGELGGVDAYLARVGALQLVADEAKLDEVEWTKPTPPTVLPKNPDLVGQLAGALESRVAH